MKKVTVLIPCHNEEEGIGKVIKSIPVEYLKQVGLKTEIVVIDNNSTDKTAEVAKTAGAQVIHERNKGKGNAMLLGFKKYPKDSDYVVMMDGDNTYKGQEMYRLLEPLINNFGDVIIGSRMTGKMLDKSFKLQNRVANWAYAFFVRTFYHTNVTDVLSGYFAWKREALEDLAPHITSAGFTLEMEMVTKMLKLGHEVYSVPITYDRRDGYSKIETFKDGIKILNQLFTNIFWSPDATKHYRR